MYTISQLGMGSGVWEPRAGRGAGAGDPNEQLLSYQLSRLYQVYSNKHTLQCNHMTPGMLDTRFGPGIFAEAGAFLDRGKKRLFYAGFLWSDAPPGIQRENSSSIDMLPNMGPWQFIPHPCLLYFEEWIRWTCQRITNLIFKTYQKHPFFGPFRVSWWILAWFSA